MSVSGISGIGRLSTTVAGSNAPAVPVRQGLSDAEVEIDKVTQQPLPPRFPWLSRLSQQLEAAAHQRAAFPSAPVLGDHLDQSA